MVGVSNSSDGEMEIIYEGRCSQYGSGQMRRFQLGSTVKVDLGVDIPYVIRGIRTGDLIDFQSAQFSYEGCEVVAPFTDVSFGMGTSVFFNITAN